MGILLFLIVVRHVVFWGWGLGLCIYGYGKVTCEELLALVHVLLGSKMLAAGFVSIRVIGMLQI